MHTKVSDLHSCSNINLQSYVAEIIKISKQLSLNAQNTEINKQKVDFKKMNEETTDSKSTLTQAIFF